MTKDDGGRGRGVDRDRGPHHAVYLSDVAGAAVDGDRCGDDNRTVVAAVEAVDLLDAALIDGSLEGEARQGLTAGVGVTSAIGDPQVTLRADRICRDRQHHRTKRGTRQHK